MPHLPGAPARPHNRLRRIALGVAISLGALAVLVGVAALAANSWLHSDRGLAYVQRKADEQAMQSFGGHVRFDRLGGSLIGGFTVDNAVVTNANGNTVATLRRISASYDPLPILAKRPRVSVELDGPVIDVAALRSVQTEMQSRKSGGSTNAEPLHSLTVTRLTIKEGRLDHLGHPFERLDGVALDSSADIGSDAGRLGGRGRVEIASLSATAATTSGPREIRSSGRFEWNENGAEWTVEDLKARAGDSHVAFNGSVQKGDADLAMKDLAISPADLRLLVPSSTVRKPLVANLTAKGPLDAIALTGTLKPEHGEIHFHGLLDVPGRSLKSKVNLDHVESDILPAEAEMILTAAGDFTGSLDKGGHGKADWTLNGHYERTRIDANLLSGKPTAAQIRFARRAARIVPGGRVSGSGHATLEDGAIAAHFKLALDDPGQAARLVAGSKDSATVSKSSPAPAASGLLVSGRYSKAKGHAAARMRVHSRPLAPGAGRVAPHAQKGNQK